MKDNLDPRYWGDPPTHFQFWEARLYHWRRRMAKKARQWLKDIPWRWTRTKERIYHR